MLELFCLNPALLNMKRLSVLTILCVLVVMVHGQHVNRRPDLNLGFEKRNTASGR